MSTPPKFKYVINGKTAIITNTQDSYQTKILRTENASDLEALLAPVVANILAGELVALPTETVYGLAANMMDETAVAKIFSVKGRPQDNPLIIHIADETMLQMLAADIPDKVNTLTKKFWPGPLTVVLPKTNLVPDIVSAGLPSVAVRLPDSQIFRTVIQLAGVPIVAPSANLSGLPSPTSAKHVYADLAGKIPLIVDGGESGIGVESTVVSFLEDVPVLLRPGHITLAELSDVLGDVRVHPAVLSELSSTSTQHSPGMKYKHYAPATDLTLYEGNAQDFCAYAKAHSLFPVCFLEDVPLLDGIKHLVYGSMADASSLERNLFSMLRCLDRNSVKQAIIHAPPAEDSFLSVRNRLLRSAGFKVVNELEK